MAARTLLSISAAALITTSIVGAGTAQAAGTGVGSSTRAGSASAISLLSKIPSGAERNSGYKRTKFRLWTRSGGCDTRARVLIQESKTHVQKTSSCKVVSGKWTSADDGRVIKSARSLDIVHMVPLAEAWGSGARNWNSKTRERYANDLGYAGSLIAVTSSSNRDKSDRDPAEWKPTVDSYRCTYAKTWIGVKYRWRLTVDGRERTALRGMLSRCNGQAMDKPARAGLTYVPILPPVVKELR